MSIGTLSARILMDASGVQSGMGLTRAEMRLTRQAFLDSTSDVQKLETALATLESARDKGAFKDEEAYAQAVAAVRQELDPAVKAEQDLAAAREAAAASAAAAQEEALTRGRALSESLATSDEKRAQRLSEAKDLLDRNAISQETYNRALAQMDAEKWREMGTSIRNAGAVIAATAGSISAGLALVGRDLVGAYSIQESAERKLQAAMQSNETYTAAAFARYREFASGLQELTVVGDEATLAILQHAETLGLSGIAAERAAKNAIGMQAALGISADAAIKMTAALEHGNTSLLTRYLPSLRMIEDPTERAAAAQEALGRMFGVAEAEAQSYAGSAQQLANAWGDVKEEFGAFVSDALLPMLDTGREVVAWLAGLSDGTKQTITYVGLATAGLTGLAAVGGTVVAVTGQMVIWYGALQASAVGATAATAGLTTATGAQTAASYAAIVGLKSLTVAKYAAAGAGGALAASAALFVGYNIGQTLYDWTEAGQVAARAMEGLRSGMDAITTLDFAGTAREDLEAYIASTERQIAKIQEHNAELQQGQAWWNFWQANADLIGQNSDQVQALQDALARAKTELNVGETAPAAQNQAAIDAVDKYTAKLQEQINTVGMAADQVELWRLRQEGATDAQLAAVAAMQRQAAAAAAETGLRDDTNGLIDSLQTQISEVGRSEAELVRMRLAARGLRPEWLDVVEAMQTRLAAAQEAEQVRQKVDQLTAALQEQIVTTGMSAEEVQRWQLAQQGATADQLDYIAALQGQSTAAREAEAARKDAQDRARQQQEALATSIEQTRERLQEQIATWGMTADQAELAKLAQQGASESELQELAQLQARLAELQRQKESLQSTDVTIGARGGADLFDAMARARESQIFQQQQQPVAAPPPPPLVVTSSSPQSLEQNPQVPYLSRIAIGVEALLAKEGIVVEEVKV